MSRREPTTTRHRARATALALGLLMGCGGTGAPDVPGRDHVRVAVVPYLTMMPFYVAQAEGYFERHGLDVEFIALGRNQELMTALVRGEVDVSAGILTVNELALAVGGERIRMVAAMGELAPDQCTLGAFIARRDLAESGALDDPDQVRQMTFDTDILLPFGYWAEELLRPLGLTNDDLELVNLPSPASVPAMIQGNLDLSIEMEPFFSELMNSGKATVWKPLEEIAPGYQVTLLMYAGSLLDERPEVGERFTVAMLEAIRQYRKGKTPRNVEIVQDATRLSAERVREACWPYMSEDARIRPELFRGYQEWNVAHDLVDRVLADDELFDQRFIEHANAELAQ